ncbi:3-hydroxyanthranilate 3,4-dioxygenase-like [Sycon ciliatum]|uniref:3-hydroxyanthranilate 3,4-dioxygenase-like n=1 Tax=Sycon ciliatum TaxID=27933 RepID=UPI0020ADCA80|eukprot:scpid71547/ scgid18810/ 3-hydroxyanthranilate 3,4-dioxygenase; 3-hydroxyanthranilate oxygenase; 3-hydroxyanthranilic acid dioxygenase
MADNGATKRCSTCGDESGAKKADDGVLNVTSWLEENKDNFKPPVCNKVMNNGWLKIMFVGGPNQRKDYHIECGEELFYMVKGSMVLKIMEHGTDPKDIVINEGELFCLPSRIPHSPQRNADTIGLVIERHRIAEEDDCLRYYVDGSTEILYQEMFHLKNLEKDLPPIIKRYFASEAHKTGKPVDGPYEDVIELRKEKVMEPFSFQQFLDDNADKLKEDGSISVFEGMDNKVTAFGNTTKTMSGWETWLWQWEGETQLCLERAPKRTLKKGDSFLVPADTQFTVHGNGSSLLLAFQQVVAGFDAQPPM